MQTLLLFEKKKEIADQFSYLFDVLTVEKQ